MEQEQCNTVVDINTEGSQSNKNSNTDTASPSYCGSQQQFPGETRQVTGLERQLLLNNYAAAAGGSLMSNWSKTFLCALSVILPGIGQIIGLIAGLVLVANDCDSDRRSFGAALLTVSLIVFVLQLIFWFLLALSLGPDLSF